MTTQREPHLYQVVRAGFVARGTSFSRWCVQNGILRQYAVRVLRGETRGPAATSLKLRILEAVSDHGTR
jgi:hypothetical protein